MIEVYKPTKADIEKLKPKTDALKVSGDGVFTSLQGEGITTGFPSVFLRLHYCNLACGDIEGWRCDTDYTWDKKLPEYWKEPEDWFYEKTALKIKTAWDAKFENQAKKRLVITGGEPLIQQKKVVKLLEHLHEWNIEIETNGTIMPLPELYECQFNCSPKLRNSGNFYKKRYKPEVLKVINNLSKSQFKFVVEKPADLEEVEKIVNECSLNPQKILIMPEGQTVKQVKMHASRIENLVQEKEWSMTMRNQLVWYGSKRGA